MHVISIVAETGIWDHQWENNEILALKSITCACVTNYYSVFDECVKIVGLSYAMKKHPADNLTNLQILKDYNDCVNTSFVTK